MPEQTPLACLKEVLGAITAVPLYHYGARIPGTADEFRERFVFVASDDPLTVVGTSYLMAEFYDDRTFPIETKHGDGSLIASVQPSGGFLYPRDEHPLVIPCKWVWHSGGSFLDTKTALLFLWDGQGDAHEAEGYVRLHSFTAPLEAMLPHLHQHEQNGYVRYTFVGGGITAMFDSVPGHPARVLYESHGQKGWSADLIGQDLTRAQETLQRLKTIETPVLDFIARANQERYQQPDF